MRKLCSRSCFSAFILISLLSHIIELGFNIYFAYNLWNSGGARIWFSLSTGLIIIPLVSVQLASAIFYLQRQGESTALWRHVLMAFIHVVQLGFCWRHIAILKEHFVVMKKKSLSELFLLRFMFTITSGLPLLLIQTYLFLNESPIPRSWILCVSIGITLFSSAWAVASYRRQYASCESDKLVITWPGSVFRLVWRVCELGSRIISLALFASLYKYWIFLVISFHLITMCLCVCTSVISSVSGTGCYRILKGVFAAYAYIFCFVNINRDNSAIRYTLFYIIMFLENATLCAVWMFMVPDVQTGYKYLLIFITASSFFVSVVAMSIYYKFFHVHGSNVSNDVKYGASDSEECINCKLSVCVKHNKQHQRPFNTAWLSQYDQRLIQDQYFKNLLQDSFVESSVPGDRNSTISTALSNPNLDVRNLETMSEEERHSVISFISSGTYVHRRYMDQQYQFQCDSWSEYSSDSHSVGRDRFSSTASDTDSLSQNWENQVPKTLLTDSWEGIAGKVQKTRRTQLYPEQFNSLLRKESHNWYSDDGSAIQGRNLEWSRLPVSKIARQNYKPQTESDTDSCSYRPPIRKKSKTPKIKPRKIQINMNSVDAVSEKDRAANVNDKSGNINRLTGGKRQKITRHVQYVNDDNVYMEMKSPVKLSAVYENVAFTDDILTQPEKIFNVRRDKGDNSSAPWYACSESGDSAFPTETFSSSNCAVTDIENESQSSIELMI